MKITRATAERLTKTIAFHGTPEIALHQARVQLTAIRPYTNSELEHVANVLMYIIAKTPETQTKLLGQLEVIASSTKPPAVRIGLQCNECGKKWRVSPNSDPQCPKCNGVDYEVLS